jgi:hypothetical protein
VSVPKTAKIDIEMTADTFAFGTIEGSPLN